MEVCIKEEFREVPGVRPVTPPPAITHRIEFNEWKRLARRSTVADANTNLPLKKIILDVLGARPEIWKDTKRSKHIDWQVAGVEVYERTKLVVNVKSLRYVLLQSKSALKRKLKDIIKDRNWGVLETESHMWTLPYYGHMLWYRESIREEEMRYREELWRKRVPDATEDELQILERRSSGPQPDPPGLLEDEDENDYPELIDHRDEEDEAETLGQDSTLYSHQPYQHQPTDDREYEYGHAEFMMPNEEDVIMHEEDMPAVENYEEAQEMPYGALGDFGSHLPSTSASASSMGYFPLSAMTPPNPPTALDFIRYETQSRLENIIHRTPEKEFYVKMMYNKLINALHEGRLEFHEGNLDAFYTEMIANETELLEEKAKFKRAQRAKQLEDSDQS